MTDDNMLDDNFPVSQRLTSDPTTTPQQCTKEIDNSATRADSTISETCPQLATTMQNEIPPLRGAKEKAHKIRRNCATQNLTALLD